MEYIIVTRSLVDALCKIATPLQYRKTHRLRIKSCWPGAGELVIHRVWLLAYAVGILGTIILETEKW